MKRISNSEAHSYVDSRSEFKTNNETMFGRRFTNTYAVFSYGTHFPMYVYDFDSGSWVGNKDKYSRTTSSHQTKSRPSAPITNWFDTETMKRIVHFGLAHIVAERMEQ